MEYLRFVGEAKGVRGAKLERQLEAVVDQTGLGPVAHRRIFALSKGYRQRVGIAQALLGGPEVIILDEPTVGLDPIQIIEIRGLIRELGQTHTVIFSSHILSEVQNLCDQKGRLVAFDDPASLERRLRNSKEILLTTEGAPESVEAILTGMDEITECQVETGEDGLLSVRIQTECQDLYQVSRELFFAFAERGRPLLELTLRKATLEDVFLELTEHESSTMPVEPAVSEESEAIDP